MNSAPPHSALPSQNTAPNMAALIAANDAALAALAALPPFEPVASVGYVSQGRLLILADDSSATLTAQAMSALQQSLSVAVLWRGKDVPAFNADDVEIKRGEVDSLTGYLGAFALQWREASTAGSATSSPAQSSAFDLVLDLSREPVFSMHQPPQGVFRAHDAASLAAALAELPNSVGEFEKPKFFNYKESLCAHSRSKKSGCNKCIEICSTQAISSAGDTVVVDPHLCMGCGACASVCPSGAMRYQYPRVADRGVQLRAAVSAYRETLNAPNAAPVLVFRASSTVTLALPPNAIAMDAWHVASIGADIMLGAVAYGAAGVVLLGDGSEAPAYQAGLEREMTLAETILHALGYTGKHFAWVSAAAENDVETTIADIARAITSPRVATFHLTDDKRATMEFAIEHLVQAASLRTAAPSADAMPASIALPAGSLYGTLNVDREKCTMCLACAGACPASALMDGGEEPKLKFLERNCVQCGLCANTCPENAITLVPRLNLTETRKKEVVLNETEPFNCVSCGKALGTRKLIDTMMAKLVGHSMFAEPGSLRRLQMCADCRVVDMMSNKHEISVLTGKPMNMDDANAAKKGGE